MTVNFLALLASNELYAMVRVSSEHNSFRILLLIASYKAKLFLQQYLRFDRAL